MTRRNSVVLEEADPARTRFRSHAIFGAAGALLFTLPGCATVRMHDEAELASVGRSCGFAAGEVVQETEEPRLLFLYSVAPPRERLVCIARWSRRHALHLVYVQAVNQGSR